MGWYVLRDGSSKPSTPQPAPRPSFWRVRNIISSYHTLLALYRRFPRACVDKKPDGYNGALVYSIARFLDCFVSCSVAMAFTRVATFFHAVILGAGVVGGLLLISLRSGLLASLYKLGPARAMHAGRFLPVRKAHCYIEI
jgi:hypothetical protein